MTRLFDITTTVGFEGGLPSYGLDVLGFMNIRAFESGGDCLFAYLLMLFVEI